MIEKDESPEEVFDPVIKPIRLSGPTFLRLTLYLVVLPAFECVRQIDFLYPPK